MNPNTRRHQTLVISDQTIIRDVTVTDTHLVDGKLNGYVVLDNMPAITWLVRQIRPEGTAWHIIGWVRTR